MLSPDIVQMAKLYPVLIQTDPVTTPDSNTLSKDTTNQDGTTTNPKSKCSYKTFIWLVATLLAVLVFYRILVTNNPNMVSSGSANGSCTSRSIFYVVIVTLIGLLFVTLLTLE